MKSYFKSMKKTAKYFDTYYILLNFAADYDGRNKQTQAGPFIS